MKVFQIGRAYWNCHLFNISVCISGVAYRYVYHVLIFKFSGTGLSIWIACVPNKYSIVLTTRQVELHWKLSVLCIVTFDKEKSHISNYIFFSGNSNNKCCFGTLWCGIIDYCIKASVQMAAQSESERDHPFLFTTSFNAK